MKRYVLLLQCKDQKGIVAKFSGLIFKAGGNIVNADQHSTGPGGGYFFMRIEFDLGAPLGLKPMVPSNNIKNELGLLARGFKAKVMFYEKQRLLRMGVFVSRPQHCLAEILYLWRTGELRVEIPCVISNCEDHAQLVKQHKIPFYFIPATKKNRREKDLLHFVAGSTDFLVLSRYMLILSEKFLRAYKKDIINIHHGFLPSFKGGNPYAQALNKGVKVIGATSHFVNDRLDEGPIIAQAVEQVSHKDDLKALIRKGRNLEKRALVDAISAYVDYRIIRHNNTTVVF